MNSDMLVLDSVGFARCQEHPEGVAFSECCQRGRNYLMNHPLCYAVDVVAARHDGIAPMPFGGAKVEPNRAAWLALARARHGAEELRSPSIGARHLLLGLLRPEDSLLSQVLARFGAGKGTEVAAITRRSLKAKEGQHPPGPLRRNDSFDAVIQRAELLADRSPDEGFGLLTEGHLVQALLEMPSQVERVLARCGLTPSQCLEALRDFQRPDKLSSDWHSTGLAD
jgi:hypothetical protein